MKAERGIEACVQVQTCLLPVRGHPGVAGSEGKNFPWCVQERAEQPGGGCQKLPLEPERSCQRWPCTSCRAVGESLHFLTSEIGMTKTYAQACWSAGVSLRGTRG